MAGRTRSKSEAKQQSEKQDRTETTTTDVGQTLETKTGSRRAESPSWKSLLTQRRLKTMMSPPTSVVLLLLSFCTLISGECDQCQFTANDEEDCKVYGAIDDQLIAWHAASSDCLEQYTIAISSIDPSSVGCDNPRNVNSFVNGIRFETIPNSVRGGLGVSESGFFEQGQNGVYALKDTITVNGSTFDCEASESNCYNAMKDYFAVSPGMEEMNEVCDTVVNKVAVDRELEQSTVRNQLCSDIKAGTSPPTVCEPLATQVSDEVNANPTKDCSGFQFGPGNMEIPGCGTIGGSSNSGNTTSGAFIRDFGRYAILWLLVMVYGGMA